MFNKYIIIIQLIIYIFFMVQYKHISSHIFDIEKDVRIIILKSKHLSHANIEIIFKALSYGRQPIFVHITQVAKKLLSKSRIPLLYKLGWDPRDTLTWFSQITISFAQDIKWQIKLLLDIKYSFFLLTFGDYCQYKLKNSKKDYKFNVQMPASSGIIDCKI